MGKRKEWFETFFTGLYGEVLASQFDADESLRQARLVKRLLRLKKGARILDIPCGMGRLTLPLARMGFEMTGLDLTERFIRRARRGAKRAGVEIRYVRRDMRDIDYDGEFDAVVNWFTSFRYFGDEEDLAFLGQMLKALRPQGRLVLETMNKSRYFRRDDSWRSERDIGGVHIENSGNFDRRTGRMTNRWRMSRGGETEVHTVRVRAFNGSEMRALLRKAGFRDIRFFTGPPLGRFTRHSLRLIAVAKRPRGRAKQPAPRVRWDHQLNR
ncbi:MAG: SAM-dependent methyltransferase [Planctomycetota bacterium]|jgi:SAM-dependent methyltransferase